MFMLNVTKVSNNEINICKICEQKINMATITLLCSGSTLNLLVLLHTFYYLLHVKCIS